ncbi:hypothetical protein LINPERPRIM_LOCUS31880, partial [Linum perenne]
NDIKPGVEEVENQSGSGLHVHGQTELSRHGSDEVYAFKSWNRFIKWVNPRDAEHYLSRELTRNFLKNSANQLTFYGLVLQEAAAVAAATSIPTATNFPLQPFNGGLSEVTPHTFGGSSFTANSCHKIEQQDQSPTEPSIADNSTGKGLLTSVVVEEINNQ